MKDVTVDEYTATAQYVGVWPRISCACCRCARIPARRLARSRRLYRIRPARSLTTWACSGAATQ
eukprot:1128889-Pyramimonas_sp.AAC.1